MDEVRAFLQRFGQENEITLRWSFDQDPEATHPEKIEVTWTDDEGQSWSSDVLGHVGRPGADHVARAILEAAREALKD